MRENRLRWFGHVQHIGSKDAPMKRSDMLVLEGDAWRRGRPKLIGINTMRKDSMRIDLTEDIAYNCAILKSTTFV